MSVVTVGEDRIRICWWDGLLETQQKFFFSPSTRKCYIGPFGSGKSEILCRVFLDILWRRPAMRGIIGRLHLNDFKNTTYLTLNRLLPAELVVRRNESDGTVVMHSKDPEHPSTFRMAHYDEESQYGSWEGGVAAFDEITEIPWKIWQFVVEGRLRQTAVDGTHLPAYYGLGAGNPSGHDPYYHAFHSESPDRVAGYELFTPKPYENAKHLPPNYYQNLEKKYSREWVARYVHGSFDVFEGQVYPDLLRSKHLKPNDALPMPPPWEWPRIISLDHGLRNPTSVGFWCVDWDGNLWRYDEHYEAGRPIAHHVQVIKEKVARHCAKAKEITWVADPSIFAKTQSRGGKFYSVYDEYLEHGLDEWQPGENDKNAGRNRVTEYIRSDKLFCLERCRNWWREMTGLKWKHAVVTADGERVVEEESGIDNHTVDETRYAVMTRPDLPERPEPEFKEPTRQEIRQDRARRTTKGVYDRYREERQREDDSGGGDFV